MGRRTRRKQSHKKNWLLLIPLGILVVGVIWLTLPQSTPMQQQGNGGVSLLVTMSGWSPNHFKAKAGVPINVTLLTNANEASMSDSTHSFILNETGTHVLVKAGETRTFTITFLHAGVYSFWCLTCCGITKPNPSSSFMSGQVTVT